MLAGQPCQIKACNTDFGDCDGNAANGCEANLSSINNCGACGVVCSPTPFQKIGKVSARSGGSAMSKSGASKGSFLSGRVLPVPANSQGRRDVASAGTSVPLAAPFGTRAERRVLQLRTALFRPGVRRLAQPSMKFFDHAGLTGTRFADDQD
jgi:hypothetical protein